MKQEDPSFSLDSSPRPETGKKASFAERNTHRFTIYISLAIAAFAAYLGTLGGKLTHNWVGMFLWCMILGSEEISKAVGRTPEEIEYLEKRIGTAYVISGFTSVTVLSIVVATIMAKIL